MTLTRWFLKMFQSHQLTPELTGRETWRYDAAEEPDDKWALSFDIDWQIRACANWLNVLPHPKHSFFSGSMKSRSESRVGDPGSFLDMISYHNFSPDQIQSFRIFLWIEVSDVSGGFLSFFARHPDQILRMTEVGCFFCTDSFHFHQKWWRHPFFRWRH